MTLSKPCEKRLSLPSDPDSELTHYVDDYFPDGQVPEHLGREVPHLWTRPLRELTPQTSLGFEVIAFAKAVLGIELFPWQKWLLVHALELKEDGTYRFSKLIILVARQNGKTTLLVVLSLWWLYVDSKRHTDRLHPRDFLILGTAQDLDTAKEAWDRANVYTDPDPENEAGVKMLQDRSLKPTMANGAVSMRTKSGAKYRIKAASRGGGRGKSAARILMDELREQQTWDAWSSVTKTKNAIFNSQLWGLSNAGDGKSVVLKHMREQLLKSIQLWDRLGVSADPKLYHQWAKQVDPTMALFEWSAPDGCDLDDPDAIAQANPSLGFTVTWETVMSDMMGDPEPVYRTEVLCQWVTANIKSPVPVEDGNRQEDPESEIDPASDVVAGIDVAANRSMSYISVAGWRSDGNVHVEAVAQREGMVWVPDYVRALYTTSGISRYYLQARGCPASELIDALEGLTDASGEPLDIEVVPVGGSDLGAATGKLVDRVEDGTLWHRPQPVLQQAVEGGVARRLGDQMVIDRIGSPVDPACLVSSMFAVYGLHQVPEEAMVSAYAVDGSGDNEGTDWWL